MFGSDLGSVVGGLINNGRSLPTIDISALLNTIAKNQNINTGYIQNMPSELAPLYAAYQAALGNAGTSLQGATTGIGNNLLDQTKSLYGPTSPAVMATLAGLKQNDYSTLPGTLNTLRASLAGSGGLDRGSAARAIQSAVLAPASQFSQQSATVQGQQLQSQQQNVQQALNKIASMDDATANSLFGMSKEQATQILTSGRSDLQTQLSDLINTNNTATNATLSAEGLAANNAYQNAVTRRNQQAAITNGLVNLGVDAGSMAIGGFGGGAGSQGFDALAAQGLASTPPPGSNYAPQGQ